MTPIHHMTPLYNQDVENINNVGQNYCIPRIYCEVNNEIQRVKPIIEELHKIEEVRTEWSQYNVAIYRAINLSASIT